ncbi:MAG: hypothetical protein R3250_02775 [Melioribacteraceae bacterium]|nr:hypothetical protein [Melioribacteraceae bacterium]
MKKLALIALVKSILLVQCYSQYQYLPDEVDYEDYNNLYSVTFKDSVKYRFEDGKYSFKLKSDSLLIV